MVVFNLVDVVILKFPTNSLALTQTRDFFTIVDFICINKKIATILQGFGTRSRQKRLANSYLLTNRQSLTPISLSNDVE
jgi:hypothetical protein